MAVEGPQRRAHQKEEDGGRNGQCGVDVDAFAGFAFGGGGQVALNDGLVGAVGGDVGEEGCDQHGPHGRLAQVESRRSEVELPGFGGRCDDGSEILGELEADDDQHRDGGAQEHDDLQGFGPRHGFDTAHECISEAQDAHQGYAEEDVETRDDVEGDRWQQQHDAHASDLEEDESDAAQDAHEGIEPCFEVFIGRGDIEPAVEGDEQQHDDRYGQHDARVEEQIAPIRGIGFGRNGHEGDGAERRSEDAQPDDEPRDASPSLEVVVGGLLVFREVPADECQREEIEGDDADVEPRQAVDGALECSPQQDGGAHARADFAARDQDAVVVREDVRRDRKVDFIGDRNFRKGFRDRVVEPQHPVVGIGSVAAADQQNVVGAEWRRRSGHDRKFSFEAVPAPEPRVVAVPVFVNGPGRIAREVAAAEQVETVVESVALRGRYRKRPGRAGPRRQLLPSASAVVEIEHEEVAGGGGSPPHLFDAAGHVDAVADQSSCGIGQGTRERGPGREAGPVAVERQKRYLIRAVRGVAAADAEHAFGQCDRDSVGPGCRQGVADDLPAPGGVVEV